MFIHQRSQRGFTLIELLIVIILIGTLLAIVVAKLPGSTHYGVGAIAQKLAYDIRYTQSLAMSHGQQYTITLNRKNYTIKQQGQTNLTREVNLPTEFTLSTRNQTITFNSLGEPTQSFRGGKAKIRLASNEGTKRTLYVNNVTGFVEVGT